jgi:hypothetical protein
MFYSLITGLLTFIKAKRPVNQWLIKPLRDLINIRSVWKPDNTMVTQLLRNSITTVSTGQSYQDNRSASAPLSRQDCQTLRMLTE